MKKNIILICLVLVSISYGQTKKKIKTKKSNTEKVILQNTIVKETVKEEQISIESHKPTENIMIGDNGNSENENSIYNADAIEIKPEFRGGKSALNKFLLSNLKIEQPAEGDRIVGKVYIAFVVEKTGQLTDLKVLKDLGGNTGKEVLRVCNMMPKWTSGNHNGKPVRTFYTLPVTIDGK